jgi:hypothetical protein
VVGGLGGREAYPRVYNVRAIGAGDDRIEVQFRDLWEVVGEPGDAQRDVLQSGEVVSFTMRVALARRQRPSGPCQRDVRPP